MLIRVINIYGVIVIVTICPCFLSLESVISTLSGKKLRQRASCLFALPHAKSHAQEPYAFRLSHYTCILDVPL